MGAKIHTTEQIIAKLREVERLQATGHSISEACKQIAASEHTFYKWRTRFGTMRPGEAKRLRELGRENGQLKKLVADQALDLLMLKEVARGKYFARLGKRRAARHLQQKFAVSQRRACRVVGRSRASHRYREKSSGEQTRLSKRVRELAVKHPRCGYRRITALLRVGGWSVNRKRVGRIWRPGGLRVATKQRERRRLGSHDGAATRRRAISRNEVWGYDFVMDQTADGRRLKMLPVVDEYTRECLGIEVARSLTASDVIATLAKLFTTHGAPHYLRSDNGPEFVAGAVKNWLAQSGVETLYIEPGRRVAERLCGEFQLALQRRTLRP